MTQEMIEAQIAIEAEAAHRIAQVKADTKFMAGVYHAMTDPEPPTPWKDLKRK
jgi:hypothetical protein